VFLSLTSVIGIPECWSRINVINTTNALLHVIGLALEDEQDNIYISKDTILFVGGRLHDVSSISVDEVCAVYRDVISHVSEKGYNILWKDHPVTREPLYDELVKQTGIEMQKLPAGKIAEICLFNKPVSAVVGGISTSLFNFNVLFHTNTYTFLSEEWIERINPFDAWVANLTCQRIPSYEQIRSRNVLCE
jgi:hypothetical protein